MVYGLGFRERAGGGGGGSICRAEMGPQFGAPLKTAL